MSSFAPTGNASARARAADPIINNGFWPTIDPVEFRDARRIDGTVTLPRVQDALLTAMATVNRVLRHWQGGAEDEVLMRIMLWRIDVGDIPAALSIARYAMRHQLDPGEQFQRSTSAILAEESADQALALADDDDSMLEALIEINALIEGKDMHDQIRAKLHKALGNGYRASGDLLNALTHYQRAFELNDRVGVKKDIDRIERALKKEQPQQDIAQSG